MTEQEHLLVCLAEEAAEVAQECGKALRFGLTDEFNGPQVRDRLAGELNDLLAVVNMLGSIGAIDCEVVFSQLRMSAKQTKVIHFMGYAADRGLLVDAQESGHGRIRG